MQKITPFLWFNNNAEEAMNFNASILKNSQMVVKKINHYPTQFGKKIKHHHIFD